MNQKRTEFEMETEQYLEKYNIYGLFHRLTEQLVIEKPNDPLGFLLNLLERPNSKQQLRSPVDRSPRSTRIYVFIKSWYNC